MLNPSVLVIGAGVTGITVAQRLAKNNIKVYLVEKESYIGGQALSYNCNGVESCNRCSVCLLQRKVREIEEYFPDILFKTNSEIERVKRLKEHFEVTLNKKMSIINPNICQACGLCKKLCPTSAISVSHPQSIPRTYSISTDYCLNFRGREECHVCVDACPFGAISFDTKIEKELLSDISAIVLAVGFQPWDPKPKVEYGYGKNKNVVTATEFKKQLYTHGYAFRPSDKKRAKKIAIIQCVGSRDRSIDNQNCSRVCCGYGMHLGRLLKEQDSETEVSIFYMDIQPFGKEFNKFFSECKKEFNIQYLKSIPSQISEDKQGRVRIRYEDPQNGNIKYQYFDLAILSIASNPDIGFGKLAENLDIWVKDSGFCESPDVMQGNKTSREGIFVAGACQGPKDISECIASAEDAALEVMLYLA
ncbi:MAG: FAD-dependent oxidoreductase [Caldisericia bacterium]|nr:FAD-dependent oxidoreductase [Caldisericia bacterium]MDD5688951.1 FAD-dependent oxidoreductase [Caldisericia bacterium]